MFKKMTDLQASLQAEKAQLESDIAELQAILEAPEPAPFDEFTAAGRITQAKTKDHLEGTNTADATVKAVDKERAEAAKKQEAHTNQVAEITKKLIPMRAQLSSINSEIASLGWKAENLIRDAANERLNAAIEAYQITAAALLKDLIEIEAINALIVNDPHHNFTRIIRKIESLPAITRDTPEKVGHWQFQESPDNKLIITEADALQAVRNRHSAIIEEIKGELYEQ